MAKTVPIPEHPCVRESKRTRSPNVNLVWTVKTCMGPPVADWRHVQDLVTKLCFVMSIREALLRSTSPGRWQTREAELRKTGITKQSFVTRKTRKRTPRWRRWRLGFIV